MRKYFMDPRVSCGAAGQNLIFCMALGGGHREAAFSGPGPDPRA